MPEIEIPNDWNPRWYQQPTWEYLERGGKRCVMVCHRRWGKDDLALHWTCVAAHQRVATYWHMLPIAAQARKAIWEAVNPHSGIRRIDEAFPKALRANTNEQEMFIRFKNGSTWRVVGSDNYDSLVGSPPAGVVVSEWALAKPAAWAYLAPILVENDGWALFLYTPRGKNHGWTLYDGQKDAKGWHVEKQDIHFTEAVPPEALEAYLDENKAIFGAEMAQALYDQEWLCSFDAAVIGAYYGGLLKLADEQGRIGEVPFDPALPVHTAWDIGVGDDTAIWFVQQAGPRIHVIDCFADHGKGVDHYWTELRKREIERGYSYGKHYGPHDVASHEWGSGRTREEQAFKLGLKFTIVPRVAIKDDGHNAVRSILPRCYFDAKRCHQGLEALRQYRREWDDKNSCFKDHPLHDWTSHYADAFQTLALGVKQHYEPNEPVHSQPSIGDMITDHIAAASRRQRI